MSESRESLRIETGLSPTSGVDTASSFNPSFAVAAAARAAAPSLEAASGPAMPEALRDRGEALVARVLAYNPQSHSELLRRALAFAWRAHLGQQRASGEPYFRHPLEVAHLAAEKLLDDETIVTALLHDVLEDTQSSLPDIQTHFGPTIAGLTDGVTKLSRLKLRSRRENLDYDLENLRRLMLAVSRDVRVLLVKLADRLHNMRTIGHLPKAHKRRRIALETQAFFVPLASRVGLKDWSEELDNLCFETLEPYRYGSIVKRMRQFEDAHKKDLELSIEAIGQALRRADVPHDIAGRIKAPASVLRKMDRTRGHFERVTDIVAFRILTTTVEHCYKILGIIHTKRRALDHRFQDYISLPKTNGYQSLHTAVSGPSGRPIEIQIRTYAMHKSAEFGIAAHWSYKQGSPRRVTLAMAQQFQNIAEALSSDANREELLREAQNELVANDMYAFTPADDAISLPRGATVLDFAFAVHTEVGLHCKKAYINGEEASIRQELMTGDRVQILTDKTSQPQAFWMEWVKTGKARSALNTYHAQKRRAGLIFGGRQILRHSLEKKKVPFDETKIKELLPLLGYEHLDDLCIALNHGTLELREIHRLLQPPPPTPFRRRLQRMFSPESNIQHVPISGTNATIELATCCHPLPGDAICGITLPQRGVIVHRRQCASLHALRENPERWLPVTWDEDRPDGPDRPDRPGGGPEDADPAAGRYPARLRVRMLNQPKALAAVCQAIGGLNVNITALDFSSEEGEYAEAAMVIEVAHRVQMNAILAGLKTLTSVRRVTGG